MDLAPFRATIQRYTIVDVRDGSVLVHNESGANVYNTGSVVNSKGFVPIHNGNFVVVIQVRVLLKVRGVDT